MWIHVLWILEWMHCDWKTRELKTIFLIGEFENLIILPLKKKKQKKSQYPPFTQNIFVMSDKNFSIIVGSW